MSCDFRRRRQERREQADKARQQLNGNGGLPENHIVSDVIQLCCIFSVPMVILVLDLPYSEVVLYQYPGSLTEYIYIHWMSSLLKQFSQKAFSFIQ